MGRDRFGQAGMSEASKSNGGGGQGSTNPDHGLVIIPRKWGNFEDIDVYAIPRDDWLRQNAAGRDER